MKNDFSQIDIRPPKRPMEGLVMASTSPLFHKEFMFSFDCWMKTMRE